MSHHEHEFGQPWGWPHEFTREDYGDMVEPPDEEEKSPDERPARSRRTPKKSRINFEMMGRLWGG
jgi:hypothetical protein